MRRHNAFNWNARAMVALSVSATMACGGRGCSGTTSSSIQGSAPGSGTSIAAIQELRTAGRQGVLDALGIDVTKPVSTADVATWIERATNDADAADRELPRETFDVASVAKTVGSSTQSAFTWVRDNTSFVPYRGVLRGSTGVLMDRVGNSLDRALLLADLLQRGGSQVRLAHAVLSEAQGSSLLRTIRPVTSPQPAAAPKESAMDPIAEYASAKGLDQARVRGAIEKIAAAAQTARERAAAIATSQSTGLLQMMGSGRPPSTENEVAAARDHWWVQVHEGATWLDMDPTSPDAVPGKAQYRSTESVQASAVPNDQFHSVTIRVLVEALGGEKVQEATVLSHTLRPLDVYGQPIAVRHRMMDWSNGNELADPNTRAHFDKVLLERKEWLPMLAVGDATIVQSSFADTGDVHDKPGSGSGSAIKPPPAGGILDAFGGGEPSQAESQLTAEWIEFEIHTPGQANRKIRRTVFDLLGPAARVAGQFKDVTLSDSQRVRRALALVGETDILPISSRMSVEFVQHSFNANLVSQKDAIGALARVNASDGPQRLMELAGKVKPLRGELYGFALARDLFSPVRDQVYVDQVNVFSFHRRLELNEQGQIVRSNSVDLVANDIGSRAGPDAFRVRLSQGVLDTVAEALSLGTCGACGTPGNVAALWTAAPNQSGDWVRIASADDPGWNQVTVNPNTRLVMERDLAAGYTVLAPRSPAVAAGRSQFGWWRIDQSTGNTVGMMESGEGQATVERVVVGGFVTGFIGVLAWFDCMGTDRAPALDGKTLACAACTVIAGATVVATVASYGTLTPAAVVGMRAVVGALSSMAACAMAGILN